MIISQQTTSCFFDYGKFVLFVYIFYSVHHCTDVTMKIFTYSLHKGTKTRKPFVLI